MKFPIIRIELQPKLNDLYKINIGGNIFSQSNICSFNEKYE